MKTSGALFAKWPSKVSKSIRVCNKTWNRFETSQNNRKPLVRQRFDAGRKVIQTTL